MANKLFEEFRQVESKILRLTMARDNLRIISERAGLESDVSNAKNAGSSL